MDIEDTQLNFESSNSFHPALEDEKVAKLRAKYNLFINGEFVAPKSKKYFSTINPANGQKLALIAEANEKDVQSAVSVAQKAFSSWSKLSGRERGKYLFKIARALQERAREFSIIESLNGGKPIRESRDVDIPLVSAHFFYYAGWADKLEYAFPNQKIKALGVVAQIIPWNFPLLMLAWKIAPALAAGNTVVLKPAETTSISALRFAELLQDIGLPAGVVNIITGAGQTGASLIKNKNINKIAFTGSTEVGKLIQAEALSRRLPVTLELGGKSAHIIFEDADLDQAVEGVINGIFFNQGHVCCAGSRLFIQESVSQLVIRKLKDRMETLVLGNPLDKNTDVGAINSKAQKEKIEDYLKLSNQDNLEVYQTSCSLPKQGYWIKPTLILNVAQSHKIVQEEIFGPVLAVQTFRTIEEVIEKANNTPYGLSAGVWTQKGSKIFHVTQKLKAGVVWANTYNKFDPTAPFGGYKESGIGREGGTHGLAHYLDLN